MNATPESKPLKTLLLLDAATCAAMAALLLAGSTFIASVTAIPAALLFYAGIVLLPVAGLMAFTATRPDSSALVRLIVAGNLLWVAGSIWLIVGPWIAPNALGNAFIAVQALAVTGLAALEFAAMRRMTAAGGSVSAAAGGSGQ